MSQTQSRPSMPPEAARGMQSQNAANSTDASCAVNLSGVGYALLVTGGQDGIELGWGWGRGLGWGWGRGRGRDGDANGAEAGMGMGMELRIGW